MGRILPTTHRVILLTFILSPAFGAKSIFDEDAGYRDGSGSVESIDQGCTIPIGTESGTAR